MRLLIKVHHHLSQGNSEKKVKRALPRIVYLLLCRWVVWSFQSWYDSPVVCLERRWDRVICAVWLRWPYSPRSGWLVIKEADTWGALPVGVAHVNRVEDDVESRLTYAKALAARDWPPLENEDLDRKKVVAALRPHIRCQWIPENNDYLNITG